MLSDLGFLNESTTLRCSNLDLWKFILYALELSRVLRYALKLRRVILYSLELWRVILIATKWEGGGGPASTALRTLPAKADCAYSISASIYNVFH